MQFLNQNKTFQSQLLKDFGFLISEFVCFSWAKTWQEQEDELQDSKIVAQEDYQAILPSPEFNQGHRPLLEQLPIFKRMLKTTRKNLSTAI